MRRGDAGVTEVLDDAQKWALPTGELQRIGPVAAARAEFAWLNGNVNACVTEAEVGIEGSSGSERPLDCGPAVWKSRGTVLTGVPADLPPAYDLAIRGDWKASAAAFEALHMPFEQAMMLLDGDAPALDQAEALIERLGAKPLRERLAHARHTAMRPTRGTNPHGLTNRDSKSCACSRRDQRNTDARASCSFRRRRSIIMYRPSSANCRCARVRKP